MNKYTPTKEQFERDINSLFNKLDDNVCTREQNFSQLTILITTLEEQFNQPKALYDYLSVQINFRLRQYLYDYKQYLDKLTN